MNDFQSQGPRPMVDITSLNITCANCGTPITELPFQPRQMDDGTYGKLYCRECNRERRKTFKPRGGGFSRDGGGYSRG